MNIETVIAGITDEAKELTWKVKKMMYDLESPAWVEVPDSSSDKREYRQGITITLKRIEDVRKTLISIENMKMKILDARQKYIDKMHSLALGRILR